MKLCEICGENESVPRRNMCRPCVRGIYSPHEGTKPIWVDEVESMKLARQINQFFGINLSNEL